MATATESVSDAIYDGDWLRCGACGQRMSVGLIAVKDGARSQCKGCRTWNRVPIPRVRE